MDAVLLLVNRDFAQFTNNPIAIRAIERHFEIIGEATRKLMAADSNIKLEHAASIVGLRNLIAHSYDTVDNEMLWGILVNHIPKLKQEIAELKNSRSF
ncbi:MAG: DUF86 domain-containing protein [Flavobacteriales bacterium]|jgi:uncharacterized protein with HEPN domain|nr:DUF86 domain-containing protein [Flavobacteriales bacterium]